jgi:plasmid stabilization system protein ParE
MDKARNPPAAAKVGRHILDSVEGLVDHPFMSKPGRSPNTRELVTTSYAYLVVYSVEPDNDADQQKTVNILRVLHGAMRWPQEPEESA